MRFIAGVVVGIIISRPIKGAFEKSIPVSLQLKIVDGLNNAIDRLSAYSVNLDNRITKEK